MCWRGPSTLLSYGGRAVQRWLLMENSLASPRDDSRSSSELGHEEQDLISWLQAFFPSVLRRELEWGKLCVVVLGINEYEKLNY